MMGRQSSGEKMTSGDKKAVLVISSHVVRGSIGNRAVAFTLEALGHPSWILPTLTLPWHPGHGAGTRIVASSDDFSALCRDIARAGWRDEIAGVITGFMANCDQVHAIGELVVTLKENNPTLVYLCDPVIGDFLSTTDQNTYGTQGRLYVGEDIANAINDTLLPIADIATPNLYELGWLATGKEAGNQKQMLEQARKLAREKSIANLLVTSVPGMMRGGIGSVLVSGNTEIMSEHKALNNPPNGLGDLTSALFLSHYLAGRTSEKILEMTSASVFEILVRTASENRDELALESNIGSLSRPMAMVTMRKLGSVSAGN